jgi:predicted dehydrogenase
MDKKVAGAGSMADKGSHLVDLARYLVGEFEEVVGATEIFVEERPLPGASGTGRVTTDDAAAFLARFQNGALGLFGASRMSAGHKNSLGFEVNGSLGSVIFELERLNELRVYLVSEQPEVQGFRTVMVTDPDHAYMQHWWPPGHVIGWERSFIHQYYELLKSVVENTASSPSFYDGMKAQEVLEAVEQATLQKRWVTVPQGEGRLPRS